MSEHKINKSKKILVDVGPTEQMALTSGHYKESSFDKGKNESIRSSRM